MKQLLTILLSIAAMAANAQDTSGINTLRQSGKIYVVIAVLSVIFLGIIIYMIRTDRRISKIEQQQKNNPNK
jgi:heme/copper-type cytochrome/quinol oxidase subunit 2